MKTINYLHTNHLISAIKDLSFVTAYLTGPSIAARHQTGTIKKYIYTYVYAWIC